MPIPLDIQSNYQAVVYLDSDVLTFLLGNSALFCWKYCMEICKEKFNGAGLYL